MVLALLLSACSMGLLDADAAGTPAAAAEAANDFLSLLTQQAAADAWVHLAPGTRTAIYGNDESVFESDVADAVWSPLRWRTGPVTDYEISWGVNVVVEEGDVPEFLLTRRIAGRPDQATGSGPSHLLLLVQLLEDGEYQVSGSGLDTE
jgi:hypothetical protein